MYAAWKVLGHRGIKLGYWDSSGMDVYKPVVTDSRSGILFSVPGFAVPISTQHMLQAMGARHGWLWSLFMRFRFIRRSSCTKGISRYAECEE